MDNETVLIIYIPCRSGLGMELEGKTTSYAHLHQTQTEQRYFVVAKLAIDSDNILLMTLIFVQ